MKSSIERAMEKLEIDAVKVDAVQFSKASKRDQDIALDLMTEEEKLQNIRELQLVDEDLHGLVKWKDVK